MPLALRVRSLFAVAVLCLLVGIPAFAQTETATLSGVIQDPKGAVVPDAEVTATRIETGTAVTTRTNGAGIYFFTGLVPGHYHLVVRKPGFKEIAIKDLELVVQDKLEQNFSLEIGSVSETVTVTAHAPLLNTTDGSVSTVVDRNFVENMPLNGRSFQALILLTPGVVTASPQTLQNLGGQGEFSVNGQRTESNYYTVDGVSANLGVAPGAPNTPGTGGSLPAATTLGTTQGLVSIDALQEFRVESSTFSAEHGRNPGGQFSFVTRSGTNQWHGSAFDYLRNNVFDANDWFNNFHGLPQPPERQNDFGGTLGGPIHIPHLYDAKNRTFFFFSYEGLRLTQPQPANPSFGPDAYLRACTPSPLKQLMTAFPAPTVSTGTPNCANPDPESGQSQSISTWSNPNSIDAVSARVDQVLTDKLRLFFRFSDTPSTSAMRSTAVPSDRFSSSYTTRTYTVGATASLSSRANNELRLNYSSNRAATISTLDNFGGAQPADFAQLQGIDTNAYPYYSISISLPFGGGTSISQSVFAALQRQWDFVDTLNVSIGRHRLKFGADYRRLTPLVSQSNPFDLYSFFSPSAVLANNADFAGVQANSVAYPLYTNFSSFAEDEWSLTPRLTVSMGLRWEVNPAPGVTRGLKPYTLEGANNPATMTLAPQGTPLWQTNWHHFAPRFGAAYVMRNTVGSETVLKGGAGMFYDTAQQTGSWGFQGIGFNAVMLFSTFSNPNVTRAFPMPALAVPPTIVNPPMAPYSGSILYASPQNLQLPYTVHANLGLEQALGKSQALKVTYVGAFGRKLLEQSIPANVNPIFDPGSVALFKNGLSSDYNSLQVQFQRRLSHGLQALASYTWSHCFDYGSENVAYSYKRGNCNFDVRNNVSSALSYELPDAFHNHFARAALHHWAVDDRLTARTSFPVTVNGPCLFDPVAQQFECIGLNVVQGQPLYVHGTQYPGGRAINANAFTLPAGCVSLFFCPSPAGPGNAPRNFARGFGAWQMDLAIRRDFPIHESLKLQFRAEAFNIFNHPNFGTINQSYCSLDPNSPNFVPGCNFGQSTATLATSLSVLSPLYQMGGPRSMQFALRLVF